jgi:hypothetical protein
MKLLETLVNLRPEVVDRVVEAAKVSLLYDGISKYME